MPLTISLLENKHVGGCKIWNRFFLTKTPQFQLQVLIFDDVHMRIGCNCTDFLFHLFWVLTAEDEVFWCVQLMPLERPWTNWNNDISREIYPKMNIINFHFVESIQYCLQLFSRNSSALGSPPNSIDYLSGAALLFALNCMWMA